MAQPNAQNSELDPKTHPSGARIEKMYQDVKGEKKAVDPKTVDSNGEKGLYGETLRPSEREDSYVEDNHRRSPEDRQS